MPTIVISATKRYDYNIFLHVKNLSCKDENNCFKMKINNLSAMLFVFQHYTNHKQHFA